jgi:ABC-2 type transport system ATP-binding protein
MIETFQLTKNFNEFVAVDGVTLKVKAGQVLALLGPNGAGKTTTVRMLTSILRPTRGWAKIAGYDVVNDAEKVRAVVGVLTENHGLYGRMRAGEYLDFFGQLYGMKPVRRRERIAALLEQFGLTNHRNRRIGEFSKGMRQKLALARALLHSPPVLLLDEPTSAMDPESARLVRDAIQELRSGERAVIICTHNLVEAEELADQIAIIRRGKIIALGSSQALKQKLLGPGEFEAQLAAPFRKLPVGLTEAIEIREQGETWFRYRSAQPERDNPLVLKILLQANMPVISLRPAPRSLEQVYLRAVTAPDDESVFYVE